MGEKAYVHVADTDKNWVFVTGFNMETMTVNSEKLIYDGIDIISSIGGALGMFLGWSFYQMHHDMVEVVRNFLNK